MLREMITGNFCRLLLIVNGFLSALILSGCGGGAQNSGFPNQVRITPTQGVVEGRIESPGLLSDSNLNNSLQKADIAKSFNASKNSVRQTLGQVVDFSGFSITAKYEMSSGVFKEISGLVKSDGTYFIGDVPFGVELEITVTRGKLALQATIPPLQAENSQVSKIVNVESTAETLLYKKLKESSPALTIESKNQFQSFESEKNLLVELINNELKNENIDAQSPSLLDRPIINQTVERSAKEVNGSSELGGDHLPYAVIDLVQENQKGRIQLDFRLFDVESDLANIMLMYSKSGSTFATAALGEGGSGLSNLQTSRNAGISHTIYWESAADLGVGIQQDVVIALYVFPVNKDQIADFRTIAYTSTFLVDNTGLPEIASISPNFYELGKVGTIEILGSNLSNVRAISLQYFGSETFISPRKVDLDSNSFEIKNGRIDVNLHTFNFFPVEYRLILNGAEDNENAVSSQSILMQEASFPKFSSVNLTPSTTFNDSYSEISFTGKHLLGAYSDRVRIENITDSSVGYGLQPLSVVPTEDSTDPNFRWTGKLTTLVRTGDYNIYVKNSTNQEVLVPDQITISEDVAVIENIEVQFGVAVNNIESKVFISGRRLSSVTEALISTDKNSLDDHFLGISPDKPIISLNVDNSSYDRVEATLALGQMPGVYFVGVRNETGFSISTTTFEISEGVIPANSLSVAVQQNGVPVPSKQINNRSDFDLIVTGTSLSSLQIVRLINQDLNKIINLTPISTTFNQAVINVPIHNAPGKYRIDLINSAGLTSTNCNSTSCFEITEDPPILNSFENTFKPTDLNSKQMLAGDGAQLKISGENLAGAKIVRLCVSALDCPYEYTSVVGEFFEAAASIGSQPYITPGTYSLEIETLGGGKSQTVAGQGLEVFERQPKIDFIAPQVLTTKDLRDQTNVVTFTGSNLFGVDQICLLPFDENLDGCDTSCTVTATYFFTGSEITGVDRNKVTLSLAPNSTPIVPGNYVWKVRNFAPPTSEDTSFCSTMLHDFYVTEPPVEFVSFVGSPTANSVKVFDHTTTAVKVVGSNLYSLDHAELRRRFNINNLDSVFDLVIETTALNSADLTVPASLIPGIYDLYLKNTDMSTAELVVASVEVIEVLTPVVTQVNLRGQNQLNTTTVYFDLFGEHIAGAWVANKSIELVDSRESSHIVTITTSNMSLESRADQVPFIKFAIPPNTVGGDYRVLLTNSANLRSDFSVAKKITIKEPAIQFRSVSVVGPFSQDFGFGENNKSTRLEFRGSNLGSTDEIRLSRENSLDTIVLTTPVIDRNFGSADLTVVATFGKYFRPGFYNVELRNNSGDFSELIDPISSPFFEQVQILDGAPDLQSVGCLDISGSQASCSTTSVDKNVDGPKDFEFTGRNLYTLKRIDFFREGDYSSPEFSFPSQVGATLPQFGQSLDGTGVLTRTSYALRLDLPNSLKYLGYYDIELTNAISSVRFPKKLQSVELFKATISSITTSVMLNNQNKDLTISGDHMTGTSYVGLWDSTFTSEVAPIQFNVDPDTPKTKVHVTIPENIAPGDYKIKVINSLGFSPQQEQDNNKFEIKEPPPSIDELSKVIVTNAQTQVIQVTGDGFLGLKSILLKPSESGQAGTSNTSMGLKHVDISLLSYSVTSRSLMSFEIPAYQLPGYYEIHMSNKGSVKQTDPLTYAHGEPIEIRELPPIIETLTPSSMIYSEAETSLTVSGSNFLGVTATPSSSTWAKLVHIDTGEVRQLDRVSVPQFKSITFTISENLLIGAYELEIKNTQGIASSLATTQFIIEEGPVELTNVSTAILQYDADFTSDSNKISIYGKNFQSISKVEIVTTILDREYRYSVDFSQGTSTPYTSVEKMPVMTDMIYPGKYWLEITNQFGTQLTTNQVIDVRIPPSSITDFNPKTGPYNAPTEIRITGTHLRRFEYLKFERISTRNDDDDSINVIQISTNSDPQIFSEISSTEARVRLVSQNPTGVFFNNATGSGSKFEIKWKTYGDLSERTVLIGGDPNNSRFQLTGFYPEVTGFKDSLGSPLLKTGDFVDWASLSVDIASISVNSGLPLDLVVEGTNFADIQSVKLVSYEDNSVHWTLDCTTGSGANALNASNSNQLSVTVPRDIFHYPAPVGTQNCGNDVSLLPLKPGVYSLVLEDGSKISNSERTSSMIYFSEELPFNLAIVDGNLEPNTIRFNDVDEEISITGDHLSGARRVVFTLSVDGTETNHSVEKSDIQSDQIKFKIKAGTLRGLQSNAMQYTVKVENSRGSADLSGGAFKIREKSPNLSNFTPSSGLSITTHLVTITGQNLLGVGRAFPGGENSLILINKESYSNANIATLNYDITANVAESTLNTLKVSMPKNIVPGEYFLSVRNDHYLSASNPRLFENIIFMSEDSAPTVTFVTPTIISDFDLLPTTLEIRGANLIGVRTATLNLLSTVTSNTVTLSLLGSPELTSSEFGLARFTLPQARSTLLQSSPFMIPGTYDITLSNLAGDYKLPNFQLDVKAKKPHIDMIVPTSTSKFDNSTITTFKIKGNNLFGMPLISAKYGSTEITLNTTGLSQSQTTIEGLTLPHSLFPDFWTISLENSTTYSTSKVIEVTEPLPEIIKVSPDGVPFNDRTKITLTGDHFIGVLTTPGSIILTDELRTPLEDIEKIDRYQISAWVPMGINVGKYEIIASNKTGSNPTSAILTILGSGLSLSSITPNTGLESGGQFVVLEGSGFVDGTKVAFGDVLAQDVKVLPERIEAFSPPAPPSIDLSTGSSSVDVKILNPDGEIFPRDDFFTYFKDNQGAPRILDVYPGTRDSTPMTNVPVNTKIAILFDQAMDSSTILTELAEATGFNAVEVFSDSEAIGGAITTWGPDKTYFVYDSLGNPFLSNKLVEIGFANVIKSEGTTGLPLDTDDVVQTSSVFFGVASDRYIEDWSFTVGDTSDSGSLKVTSPTGRGSSAPTTWTTIIEFDKHINPSTLESDDFELIETARNYRIMVDVQILPGGKRIFVDPRELLRVNHEYKLTIKKDTLESLTDQSLGADYPYYLDSEESGPSLLSISPINGETGVARNTSIIVQFDQAIRTDTVNTSNLYVEKIGGVKLEGTFSHSEDKLFYTFDFDDYLESNSNYQITISNRLKSLTGVPITSALTGVSIPSGWTSTFEVPLNSPIDSAPPVIRNVFPANLQSDVSTNATVIVSFSEAINLSDVSTNSFQLSRITELEDLMLGYRISLNTNNDTVYLTPDEPLIYSENYKLFVAAGIRDLANNKSTNSVTTMFEVTPSNDSLGPDISNVTPNKGEVDVAIQSPISITFSEAVNADDARDPEKIYLSTMAGDSVTCVYEQIGGNIVRLIPQENLMRLTQYVLTIQSDVSDLFGNPRGEISTFVFTTEDYIDTTDPEITLLTVNGIPAKLNGNDGPLFNNNEVPQTPLIQVPSNGFTIDIYYNDPGTGGESSGVEQSSIIVRDEKTVLGSQNQQLTNLNLLQQGVTPIHQPGHTRLIIPPDWTFAEGLHILTAQVKDRSSAGNTSDEVSFQFQSVPMLGNETYYPFNRGITEFSIDFASDNYTYDTLVKLGDLCIETEFGGDGFNDFDQELFLLGLISDDLVYSEGDPRLDIAPTPSVIASNITTLLQRMILEETRKLFDLEPSTGEPNNQNWGAFIRFQNNVPEINPQISRILVGGDNGEEIDGGLGVFKSSERSKSNTVNRDLFVLNNERSENPDEGYGVFSTQLIRRYANDPIGFNEWNHRFGPISYFGYTNTSGNSGLPIGFFSQDANVYNIDPSAIDSITDEFHRSRYSQMRLALESYAKIIAVSVARVAAMAVGLMPTGFPPNGLYGGSQNLPEFFIPNGSVGIFLDVVDENNLLRRDIDLNSIFQNNPGPLGFSNFAEIYLRNSIRVDN